MGEGVATGCRGNKREKYINKASPSSSRENLIPRALGQERTGKRASYFIFVVCLCVYIHVYQVHTLETLHSEYL